MLAQFWVYPKNKAGQLSNSGLAGAIKPIIHFNMETQCNDQLTAAHSLRKEISAVLDHLAELQDIVARGDGGRELALIKTKLEEAKMWGGKALGAFGSELPADYPHDNAAE